MKVRPKQGQVCYEVVEESSSYYILQDPYTTNKCVFVAAKKDYEPVQEWVDVTAQCTIETDCHGRDSLFHKNKAVFVDDCKYRVTPNGAVLYKVERKR